MLKDPVLRLKWEEVVDRFDVLKMNAKPGMDIVNYTIKTPVGVKKRDFLCLRSQTDNFEGWDRILFMKSITHPIKPPTSSPIRGEIIVSAMFLKENGDGTTKVMVYAHTNPKVITIKS